MTRLSIRDKNISVRAGIIDYPKKMYRDIVHWALAVRKVWKRDQAHNAVYDSQNSILEVVNEIKENPRSIDRDDSTLSRFIYDISSDSKVFEKILYDRYEKFDKKDPWSSKTEGLRSCNFNIYENDDKKTRGSFYFAFPLIEASTTNAGNNVAIDEETYIEFEFDKKSKQLTIETIDEQWLEDTKKRLLDFATELAFNPEGLFRFISVKEYDEGGGEYSKVELPKLSLYPKLKQVTISVDRYGIRGQKDFFKPLEKYEAVVNMARAISEELVRAEDVLEIFIRSPLLSKPERRYSIQWVTSTYGKVIKHDFNVDLSDTMQYEKHKWMREMPEDQPYDDINVRLYEKKHKSDAGSHDEVIGRITVFGLTEYDESFIKEVIKHELIHMMQVIMTRRIGEMKERFGELRCIRCRRKFEEMPDNNRCPDCDARIDYEKAGLPGYFDPYGYHRYEQKDRREGGEDYHRGHATSDVEFYTRLVDAIEQMRRIVTPPALSIEEYDHFKWQDRTEVKPEDWKKIYDYRFKKFLDQNATLRHLREAGQQQKYQKMLRELYRQFDYATKPATTAGDNSMHISKRAKVKSDKPAYKEKKKTDNGYVWVYDEKHVEKRWKEKKDKLKKLEKDLDKVRKQYRKDLKSDDERTKAIAAIVGIMDDTAMRIGNEESAKEGTYGASTLKVKHVKGGSGKMTFDFPGKGEIEQNVVLENNEIIKAVRDLMKGKKADDFIFEVDGKKIWDRAVNRYLKPLGISAKDLRGFHSNRLMKETLEKKDWKDALEEVSEIVGHEANTLKNQYLDPELVEKHEGKEKDKKDKDKKKDKKKKAFLSIRALEQTPTLEKTIKDILQKPEYGPRAITKEREVVEPEPKKPEPEVSADFTTVVDLNRNVNNVQGDIANYPHLQKAWKILAPFLPEGARLVSGWRSDNKQAKIIMEYWLSAVWKGRTPTWKKDQGFFVTNFEGPSIEALRWWLGKAKSAVPISGRLYKLINRDIEPLRQIMTTYKPSGAKGEPPESLKIAKLGTSKHLQGLAMDISGAPINEIIKAANFINTKFGNIFIQILPERGQKSVHVVIQSDIIAPGLQEVSKALLDFGKKKTQAACLAHTSRAALKPRDERFVSQLEQKYFGKPAPSVVQPERGRADLGDVYRLGKNRIGIRPRVKLTNDIVSAWVLLKPHLPRGAVMTSGFRTPEDQVRIIGNYWKKSRLDSRYPSVTDPYERSKLLKRHGYVVGPPTRPGKKPVHGSGMVFDVSGADIREIAQAAKRVSGDPNIPVNFSQVLLEEKNNAVHVGIRSTMPLSELMRKTRRAMSPIEWSKLGTSDIEEETKEQVSSIFEDLLQSNPPDNVVEEYRSAFSDMLADDGEESGKYEKEKDDPKWDEVLIDEDRKWTRREIRNHYMKNKSKIMKEIKGKPVMLFIGTGKNQNVLKRNHNDKKIVISSDKDYTYWVDRRMISIHRVLGPKTTLGFVDLDVHGDFSDAKVKEYARKIAAKIKSEYGGVTPTIYDSGGTGYHVEFTVDETSTDTLRNELRELCEELNEDFDGFTAGIVKGSGVRTDTTTLKNNGNLRVPGALHEKYGGEKKPIGKGISKDAAILDYSRNAFDTIYGSVSSLAPFLVAETMAMLLGYPGFSAEEREYIKRETKKVANAIASSFEDRDDMIRMAQIANGLMTGTIDTGIELDLDVSDLKSYNEFRKEITELQENGRYKEIVIMVARKNNAAALAMFADMPEGVGGQPLMFIFFDPARIAKLLLSGASGFNLVNDYMETLHMGITHELTHLTQSILTDAISLKKGKTIDDLNKPKDPVEKALRPEFAAGVPEHYEKERYHMYGGMQGQIPIEEFEKKYMQSDVEFFPILRNLIDEAITLVIDEHPYSYERNLIPEEHLRQVYLFGIGVLPTSLQRKLRHGRLGKYIRDHSTLQKFKEQDVKKYNKAIREIYRYVSPYVTYGKNASISVRQKVALNLDELQRDMGFGIEDEPGDFFEKSPIFRHREEVPEYDIDAGGSEASKLADNDPEKFFYRGLHKQHPELEVRALENIIENNAKFYFIFKYHEREEPEFKELAQPAAEALSLQDSRAFFYYHLHDQFPELGRGAIIQLIDTNPDSFFDLGLQKDYPDFEEAAGNARNIKDPHKVELEKPEWIDSDIEKPISLRDRNASKSISKKHKTLKERSKEIVDLPLFKSKSQETFPDILRPLAEKLAQTDPESFFYHKLQKTYPDIGRPIAEELAETDPEGFFCFKLQKTYKDIGRPIAGQLMRTDPESFFYHKLQKTYPDIGRTISIGSQYPLLSKRADGLTPIAPMKLKKMENPDKILDKHDDSEIIVQQKIDGFKTQAIKDKGGAVKLYTRRGEGFEANVPDLVSALEDKMSSGDFWLGELAYIKNGKQSISDVQTVVGSSPENAQEKLKDGGKLVFYVYDLLWDGGKNITKSPYSERYSKLQKKVGKGELVEIVKNYAYSEKDKAITDALKAGGEGIVLKPKSSEYKYGAKGSSEPVGEWAKHKPKGKKSNTDEVILDKYEKGEDKLIFPMYQYKGGELFEVGKISGMSKEDEAKIKKDIDAGKKVVIEISFQERMESGKFRHPGWSRFRPDKPAKEVKVSGWKPMISKRAAEEKTPVAIEPMLSMEEAEEQYKEWYELAKKQELWERDEYFQQQFDIRDPKPQEIVEYFLFKHYKSPKYQPYNKEMLNRLLEVQPSKFFDTNLYSEEEFELYVGKAVEAVARLEPQYFIEYIAWAIPKETVGRYLEIAKESLKDGKSLEERRNELMETKLLSDEEYKKTLIPPKKKGSRISKRAGRLDYPKKMLDDIVKWVEEVSPELKKKLFRKPKQKRVMKYFDIDLSDTDLLRKRPELTKKLEEMQDEDWHKELHVVVYAKDPGGLEASYNSPATGLHEIEIFAPSRHKNLKASVMHELTHMMQKILTSLVWPTAKGKPVGLPGRYNPETYKMYGKMEDFERGDDLTVWHARSDIEFFSKLNEEIEGMANYVMKSKDKTAAFSDYLRRSEFLQRLRNYNEDNFKKAIRELYRAFDELQPQTKLSKRATSITIDFDKFKNAIIDYAFEYQPEDEPMPSRSEIEGDLDYLFKPSLDAHNQVKSTIEQAIQRVPNWNNTPITITAQIPNPKYSFDWWMNRLEGKPPIAFWVSIGNQGITYSLDGDVDDVLDVGIEEQDPTEEWFSSDTEKSDYYGLINALQSRGAKEERLVLYSGRPIEDRKQLEEFAKQKKWPRGVWLTDSIELAHGFGADYGEARDVWRVSVMSPNVMFDQAGSVGVKNYQLYGPGELVDIISARIVAEGQKPLASRTINISKRAKKDKPKAGVFITLPDELAKKFPLLGKHDDSIPHVTALFIGKVHKKHEDLLLKIIKEVAKEYALLEMKLDDKVTYFPPTKHSDGCKIAKLKIISPDLHKFNKELKKAVKDAGIDIDDHFTGYKPHITLSYMEPPRKTYDREFPSGSWVAKEVHLWNGDKKNVISLGENKDISKRAAERDPEFMSHLDPEKKYVAEQEGFMRDVETGAREPAYLDEMVCDECGETMPLEVRKSAAGYFIGRGCSCGIYSRESGYFKSEKEAQLELDLYRMSQEEPEWPEEEGEEPDISKMSMLSKRAKDPLSTYKKKRQFDDTPEPEGKVEGKNQHRFVIQLHKAKKAGEHFDLRLENDDGTMSSWAIPKHKLPSGSEKLLAMKTEDHPISYNKFKGEIPEGEYGAGTVSIHDSGKYEEIERSTNKIVFKLRGKKEKGIYNLFKTDGKKWMIMLHKDKKESNSNNISKRRG
jgi:DNA ligase D-like protein (predicted 3'-phosphoesterase)